jgi:hypothetical protein
LEFIQVDKVTNGMISNAEVSGVGMPVLVLGQLPCEVVIAIEWSGSNRAKAKAIEELV